MIRVCHMTSAHNQTDIRIFEKECISLASNGYEVHLIAPGETVKKGNVLIHGIGNRPDKRWKRMLLSTRKVYKTANGIDADIYHFHDPELIPVGLKLIKQGKRVIFDSHENILDQFSEKEYIPIAFRKALSRFFIFYIEYACKKFSAIISVDPDICKKYKKLNRQTFMVANYPKFENIEKREVSKLYLCFAGGISKQWNHDIIINALEKLGDITYILCGNADEEYLSYLKTLPGWRKVDYRREIPHREVLSLLSGAVAGVALCSYSKNTNGRKGTLGNTKLFEIMMCGIPVISTDFYSWKQIIEKNECGYCINPKDAEQLKNIIQDIIAAPQKAVRFGERGKNLVLEKYNWEIEEKKLLKIYSQIQINVGKDFFD